VILNKVYSVFNIVWEIELYVKGSNKRTSYTYVFDNKVPMMSPLKISVIVETPKDFIINISELTLWYLLISE
jgi:hypothetical protein